MLKSNSKKNTVELLREEIENWISQDNCGNGAWDMFVMTTLPKMCKDYDTVIKYFNEISKEHFDYISDVFDELVYHYQNPMFIEKIENLYYKFYGDDKDTELYKENIANLCNCLKK